MRLVDAGFASGFFHCCENSLGSNVADEVVPGEGAAAESSERAIKTAAASLIGSEGFCLGAFGAAVEVSAEFDARDVLVRAIKNVADNFGSCIACSIG